MAEQDAAMQAKGLRPDFEKQLAEAFRDMENIVCNVRDAANLMEVVADSTLLVGGDCVEKEIRKRFNGGLKGYRIYVLTEEQSVAVTYAIKHLTDLTGHLHREYYAGFGE